MKESLRNVIDLVEGMIDDSIDGKLTERQLEKYIDNLDTELETAKSALRLLDVTSGSEDVFVPRSEDRREGLRLLDLLQLEGRVHRNGEISRIVEYLNVQARSGLNFGEVTITPFLKG